MNNMLTRALQSVGLSRIQTKSVPFDTGNPNAGSAAFAELFGVSRGDTAYNKQDALKAFRSWVFIAASRNAAAVADAGLHLYHVTKGAERPEVAEYGEVNEEQERSVRRWARKSLDPKKAAALSGNELVEIFDHPFLTLMQTCNPFRNQFDFMEETQMFFEVTGDAYWYLVPGTGSLSGIPQEMWLLPSHLMTPIPDEKLFIKGYLLRKGTGQVALAPEEVVHFRKPNILNPRIGMGNVEANYTSVLAARELDEMEYDRAKARGIHDLLLKFKSGSLQPKVRRSLLAEFQQAFLQNRRNPRPFLSDADWDATNISWSPKEMLNASQRGWSKESILNSFGQSVALWTENPNRANIEGATYLWARFYLDPCLTRIAQKINERMIPLYDSGDSLFVMFDKIAPEDREFQLRQDESDLTHNVRTVNEVRQSRGLELLEDERANDPFYGGATNALPFPGSESAESEQAFGNLKPEKPGAKGLYRVLT